MHLAAKTDFLEPTRCARWKVHALAGDASSRSYDRLIGPDGQTAILMEAGPEAAASVPPFVAISLHLASIGLCAPTILAQSHEPHFLLLTDLGTTDVARHLKEHPAEEAMLYSAAIDALLILQTSAPPTGLTRLTPAIGATMLDPLFEWFAPETPEAQQGAVRAAISDCLEEHAGPADTLSLRDFHAENLIWRPELTGTDRIGLLDFQDAFLAPAAYDLVSLLRDARRDVSPPTQAMAVSQFAEGTGQTEQKISAACAILGLQRNLRILGIFARLAKRDGKAHYTTLIPRVLGHIRADLEQPAATDLSAILAPVLDTVTA